MTNRGRPIGLAKMKKARGNPGLFHFLPAHAGVRDVRYVYVTGSVISVTPGWGCSEWSKPNQDPAALATFFSDLLKEDRTAPESTASTRL